MKERKYVYLLYLFISLNSQVFSEISVIEQTNYSAVQISFTKPSPIPLHKYNNFLILHCLHVPGTDCIMHNLWPEPNTLPNEFCMPGFVLKAWVDMSSVWSAGANDPCAIVEVEQSFVKSVG